jgi:hypothetical protein
MNQDKNLQAFEFAQNKIKKIDYPFYLIFKDSKYVSEIFTIYCFHLELANIPVASTSEETRLIRHKWWLDTIENITNLNSRISHPIISLIAENFGNNQKVIKTFKDLIVIRSKENELHGFKTEAQLKKYVDKTNNIIWQLIYQMLNQCEITNEKSKLLSDFSLGIKYLNISASLYYRDYNNHFFVSQETIEKSNDLPAQNRQYEIFKYNIKNSLNLLNSSIKDLKQHKDLRSFYIYTRINKSHLHLVEKGYNKNDMSAPPNVPRLSTLLKIKLLK